MKFEYEKLGKPMPGSETVEEGTQTEDTQPTETQDATPETDTSPDAATPESQEA